MKYFRFSALAVLIICLCSGTCSCTLNPDALQASGNDIQPGITDGPSIIPAEGTDEENENSLEALSDSDLEKLIQTLKDGISLYVSDYLPSDIEKLNALCSKAGITLDYGEDGSFTAETSAATLRYGDNWPQNALTERLPEPEFDNLIASAISNSAFEALVTGAELDEIKAYVERVKECGFTDNESISERTLLGVPIYSCSLTDAEGYTFSIDYTASLCTMSITIPKA